VSAYGKQGQEEVQLCSAKMAALRVFPFTTIEYSHDYVTHCRHLDAGRPRSRASPETSELEVICLTANAKRVELERGETRRT
jgi:hypothetical protein